MAAEKNFENRVKKFLERRGAWGVKFFANGLTRSGVPDLLYCLRGRFIAVEVKAQGGKPAPLQIVAAERIRKAGGLSVILFPSGFADFKLYIDSLDAWGPSYDGIPVLMK